MLGIFIIVNDLKPVWHDAYQFVSVCVGATQTISSSVLARNPHKGLRVRISCETGSGGGKEGPREDRESQLTTEGSRDQSAWDSNQEKEKDTINRSLHG